jgi:hypothetical protein
MEKFRQVIEKYDGLLLKKNTIEELLIELQYCEQQLSDKEVELIEEFYQNFKSNIVRVEYESVIRLRSSPMNIGLGSQDQSLWFTTFRLGDYTIAYVFYIVPEN